MNRPDEVTLKFPPEDDTFFSDLRSEIRAYFQSTGQTVYGNSAMYLKVVGLVVVYLGAYGLTWWLSPNSWWVVANYAFLGVWSVFLGVNVGHDAAHHTEQIYVIEEKDAPLHSWSFMYAQLVVSSGEQSALSKIF